MALKFAPKLRRRPKQGSRWKRWSPLLPRPSRSTTCAKLSIKEWKSAGLFSSRRPAGRAGTLFAARRLQLQAIRRIIKKRPGAGADERCGRKNRQIIGGG